MKNIIKSDVRNIVLFPSYKEDFEKCRYDYVIMRDNVIFNKKGSDGNLIEEKVRNKFSLNNQNTISIQIVCDKQDLSSSISLLNLIFHICRVNEIKNIYFYSDLLKSASVQSY